MTSVQRTSARTGVRTSDRSRKILGAVHCDVGSVGQHRSLHFFDEYALAAHGVQRHVGALIAERLDQHQFDVEPAVKFR